jgi:hypothetical protein
MRTPKNTVAQIIAKLEFENEALRWQIENGETMLAINLSGISTLAPYGEWEEEPTP